MSRADEVRRQCDRRGLAIKPHGCAWRIVGDGVDMLVAELALLRDADLEPAHAYDPWLDRQRREARRRHAQLVMT